MKLVKKLLSAAVAAAISISSFAGLTVSAAGTPKILLDYDSQTINQGDPVVLRLKSDTTMHAGFGTLFRWDAAPVQMYTDNITVSNTIAGLTGLLNTNIGYVINFGVMGSTQFRANEPMATVVIDTSDSIPVGTYKLPLDKLDIRDGAMEPVAFESEDITFTVKKAGSDVGGGDGGDTDPTPAPGGESTPKPEVTPDPGTGEVTPGPGGEATPEPGTEATPTPGTDATPEPEKTPAPEKTPNPDATPKPGEVVDPDATLPPAVTPKPGDGGESGGGQGGEVTPAPDTDPTPAPGGEATPAPGGQETPAPGGEVTPGPGGQGGEATPTPGGEATPAPGGEVTPEPTVEPTSTPVPTPKPTVRPRPTDPPHSTPNPDAKDPEEPDEVEKGGVTVESNKYKNYVLVMNDDGIITRSIIRLDDLTGNLTIELPQGIKFDKDNRVKAYVYNALNETTVPSNDLDPIVGITVTFVSKDGESYSDTTNDFGLAIVPPVSTDNTDKNGDSVVADPETGDTYNVHVMDTRGVITDARTEFGANGDVLVTLPSNSLVDIHNRITVTVTSAKTGAPVQGVTVAVFDTEGHYRSQITNAQGQIVVPPLNENETDSQGGSEVKDPSKEDGDPTATKIVKVTDERGNIVAADVYVYPDTGDIAVELPQGTVLDPQNRLIVNVTTNTGAPVVGVGVTVSDKTGNVAQGETDTKGNVMVPEKAKDVTDGQGGGDVTDTNPSTGVETKYNVSVFDQKGKISNANIGISNGEISVALPEGSLIDYENRVSVVVTDQSFAPVNGMAVTVSDNKSGKRTESTDAQGKITVPPMNEDRTDAKGAASVQDGSKESTDVAFTKNVVVSNESGSIVNADVVIDNLGQIKITLPGAAPLNAKNRTVVTVTDGQQAPIKGVFVLIADQANNSAAGLTDAKGQVMAPEKNKDVTDSNGKGDVTNTKDDVDTKYYVQVADTKGNIEDANIEIADGKLTVLLPADKTVTTSNQVTVTVTDADNKGVSGMSVTINDSNKGTATGTTSTNGAVTLPKKASSGGGGGGGGSSSSVSTLKVTVTDQNGKTITPTKSIKDNDVTLTLPTGKNLNGEGIFYTITVTDSKNNVQSGVNVTLKDKKGDTAKGRTNKNGQVVLPVTEHKAYIYGDDNGNFRPEGNITRAEAAAIFARNIAEQHNESIPKNKKSSFDDVSRDFWYNDSIAYLEKYDVITGYGDGTFGPENPITRAEFVTMATRFYELTGTVNKSGSNKFSDVRSSHWAYDYILTASAMDWISGYSDGTFGPDMSIKRAEVVAIINRMTGRVPDRTYINDNMSKLNPFDDLDDSVYWAFYDVLEAANDHDIVMKSGTEAWVN